MKYAPVGI